MLFPSLRLAALKALQEFLETNFHQTTVKKVICSLNYSLGRAVLHPILDKKILVDHKGQGTKFYFIKLNKQRKIS